jgi:hypothetical protein
VPGDARWELAAEPPAGRTVAPFKHLMQRVDPEKVQAMVEASAASER